MGKKHRTVDISGIPDLLCPVCGSIFFQPAVRMRKMSALISPTGKEEFVQHPVFCCMGAVKNKSGEGWRPCGHIVDLNNPGSYITSDQVPAPSDPPSKVDVNWDNQLVRLQG
jgi:hypothetical protein